MWKLLRVEKSHLEDKKWDAVFSREGKEKRVPFGAVGYIDYTMTDGDPEDKKRRELYRARHKVDLSGRDPTTAGYLSFFILWGESINREENIRNYKKRFNL
jgi:hypothetical protein